MKKEFNKKYAEIALYCLICVIVGVVIIFILIGARDFLVNKEYSVILKILQPFIIGAILAYLLNPPMRFLERKIFSKIIKKKKDKRLRRTLSLISTLLITFILIGLMLVMVIPQIVASVNQLTGIVADLFSPLEPVQPESVGDNTSEDEIHKIEIDKYMISNTKIGTMINEFSYDLQDFIDGMGINVNVEDTFNDLVLVFTNNIVSFAQTILQPLLNQTANIIYSTATGIVNIFIAIIISIYLLSSKETFQAQIKKILFAVFPVSFTDKLLEKARKSHEIIGGFLVGNILDSLIVGVICFIFMSVLGMNYPMLISVIICVTNIIPFFGPFIGAIPSIFFLLFAEPSQALWFTVFILVLQQIDGNIIAPKVLSSTTGLSSFWVIFAILVMNGFFGIFGMFFGVPIFAVIYLLVKELLENRLRRKNLPHDTLEYFTSEEDGATDAGAVKATDANAERGHGFLEKTTKTIRGFIDRKFKNKNGKPEDEDK